MKPRTYAFVLLASATVLPACAAAEAKTGTRVIANAGAMQCSDARRTLAQAVENYHILEGKLPRSEAALVPAYLLRASDLMDLDRNGNVIPAPGSGCN